MALASIPTAGAQPGAAPTFNPYDRSTWGASAPQDFYGQKANKIGDYQDIKGSDVNDPAFQAARWGNQMSQGSPWMTNAQDAAQKRNDYAYGGNPNGAANMQAQIGGVANGLAQNFGESYDTAAYWEGQNGAMRDQGQTLGNTFSGRADAAGKLGRAAAMRAPGQFLDSNSMQNNQTDRGYQVGAINGLNRFIDAGPAPSAAQAQLNQATDMNMANSLALARSGRGMGQGAGALRQAIGQNAMVGQQAANQAAALRAQEAQAWQQAQLGAYGQIGNISGAARQGDVSMGSYLSGTQQAGQNAADQAAQGYYGLQGTFGQQQLGALAQQQQANAQGLQASQFGLQAQQANAQTQLGALQQQNAVNVGALQGNSDYQNNLLNYYRVKAQQPVEKGTDYSPYLAAAGTALGAMVGGPGGAAAGGAAGSALGQATR